MNAVKSIFIRTMAYVKVFTFIAVVGVSFYSGVYFMAAQQNPEDAGDMMITRLEEIFKDTGDQPIIHIVPTPSLYEKAKVKVGFELPEREVVVITTQETKHMLGIQDKEDPSMIRTAFVFWGDRATKVKESTKSAWGKWSEWVTVYQR